MPRKQVKKSVAEELGLDIEKAERRLKAAALWAGKDVSDTSTPVADWNDVDPAMIIWLISVVTELRGGVTFGVTKDGSVFTVTIYFHPNRDTRYYNPTERGLNQLYMDIRALAETAG